MTKSLTCRWLVPALCLLSVACSDDPTRGAGAVEGTWELTTGEGQEVYLRIAGDDIDVFTEDVIAGCFDHVQYEVLEIDGARFRVGSAQDTFTIELRREDEALLVTAFDQEDAYVASTVDPASLALCQPPSPDADCATLPVVSLETEIEGTLEADDAENDDGSHHDLYALRVDAPAEFEIVMTSSAVDSYVALYDSTGAFIDFNDDASNLTLDARLTQSLAAGCHIVMATSAFPDEFGDYELFVTEQ